MSKEEPEQRRRFLRQVFAIVPAATVGAATTATLTACAPDGKGADDKGADDKGADKTAKAQGAAHAQARAYEPAYFTAAEWTFIHAAVDHLIPSDQFGPGALATGVPEFIDRQMQTEYGFGKLWYMQGPFHPDRVPELGYQLNLPPRDIYRHGIADCNAWCQKQHGKAFADLGKDVQVAILKDLDAGKIVLDTVPAKTFFSALLSNTKEGYFADPMYGGNQDMGGWKLVGFPGARADFADWVDQYNKKYPYGPVSIKGEKS